jgi:hypothetical protein
VLTAVSLPKGSSSERSRETAVWLLVWFEAMYFYEQTLKSCLSLLAVLIKASKDKNWP